MSAIWNRKRKLRKRNPEAKALETPLFRKRVILSKRVYNRKKVKKNQNDYKS